MAKKRLNEELLSKDAQRLALLNQYGSVIEPLEPTIRDRLFNSLFDLMGGNEATGQERNRVLRRANLGVDVSDFTPIGILSDASQGRADYAEGRPLSGTVNMAMAALGATPAGKPIKTAAQARKAGVLVKKQKSPYALSNIDPRYSPRYSPSKGMSGAEQTAMAPGIFPTIESRNLGIPTVSIFDFEGRPFMTTMSDRTAAGGLLTGLNGVNFNNPVNLRGGQDYMFDLMNSGQVWASDPKVVEQMMAAAKDLGESPLFLPWRMAPSGGDYATMTAETMVKYANQSMGAEDISRLNKIIREDGVNVTVKRKDPKNPEKYITVKINVKVPEFLGLENPLAGEQMKDLTGNQRKAILNIMDTKGRDSGGLSLSQARLAVSDQLQLNAMDAGLQNVGSVNTQRGILDISGHPTYGAGLPGEGIGRLQEDIGVYELLPELARFRAANAKTSTALQNPLMPSATDKRALQMKPYTGILTEDTLRAIQNRMASQR